MTEVQQQQQIRRRKVKLRGGVSGVGGVGVGITRTDVKKVELDRLDVYSFLCTVPNSFITYDDKQMLILSTKIVVKA